MVKWKDENTGQIYEGDEYGNPIAKPKAKTTILPSRSIEESGGIKAPNVADQFFNYFGRFVPPALTGTGGIIGGLLGLPGTPLTAGQSSVAGSALGTMAGSTTGKLLQALAPQYFGAPPVNITLDVAKDIITDVGVNKAASVTSRIFPSAGKEFFEEYIADRFKPDPSLGVDLNRSKSVAGMPDVPLTTGQFNESAETIENWFAPTAKRQHIAASRKESDKFFEPHRFVDPESIVQTGQVKGTTNRNLMKDQRESYYESFKPFVGKNTKEVEVTLPVKNKGQWGFGTAQPVSRKVKVEGAIPLVQTDKFVDDLSTQIQKELGPNDINFNSMGEGVGNHLKKIMTELDKIREMRIGIDTKTGQHTATPLMGFYQLKTLKDSLNQFLRSKADQPMKDRLSGSLRALATTINNDIDAGVKGWGTTAYNKYRRAQDYHAKMSSIFKTKTAKNLLNAGTEKGPTYSEVLEQVSADPQRMREFIAAGGDKVEARQIFRHNWSKNAFNSDRNFFDPGQALKYFDDNAAIAKELYTPAQRDSMRHFLRRSNLVQDIPSSSGAALQLSRGRAMISLGASVAMFKATGNPAYSAIIFASPLLGKQFAEKVLMNPKYSNIAAGLTKASPRSATARNGAKAILGAMKGAQVYLQTPEGREIPATINENGIPVPNSSGEIEPENDE